MDAVILAIDAGNTRIKWGVHDAHAWSASGAIETTQASSLYESVRDALPVDAAIACNVAGANVESAIESACARANIAVTFIHGEPRRLGVTNGYAHPAQLGADRWVALVAAHHAKPGHKLVVNAGTALTIDALAADGRFLGGLIVPGPALMRRSLDSATAALRESPGNVRDFPANTPDAITTGAVLAGAGAVDRLAAAMSSRGCPPGFIILSGGAARELAPALTLPHQLHDNLVLDGLQLIARST
ncbi:MAG TPA: type III pantothenate kinase [Usitatibacter sp.]|nr:type III pantothenate kinase [Usitatibacter sp.]